MSHKRAGWAHFGAAKAAAGRCQPGGQNFRFLIQIMAAAVVPAIDTCMRLHTRVRAMTKPITLEHPDKFYTGTFERSARFDVHLDETGISLGLHHTGDAKARKSLRMHIHYALFAEILHELAKTASSMPQGDVAQRAALRAAARALYRALEVDPMDENRRPGKGARRKGLDEDRNDIWQMTPEEEVLLLHVLE